MHLYSCLSSNFDHCVTRVAKRPTMKLTSGRASLESQRILIRTLATEPLSCWIAGVPCNEQHMSLSGGGYPNLFSFRNIQQDKLGCKWGHGHKRYMKIFTGIMGILVLWNLQVPCHANNEVLKCSNPWGIWHMLISNTPNAD